MQINWKFWQFKKPTQQEIDRSQCRCYIEPPVLYGIAMCEPDEYGYATVQISNCPPRSHTMPCGEKIQAGDLLQVRDGLLYKADTKKEARMQHHVFKMTQGSTGHGVFN